jgi:hypothetical protein
LQLGVSTLDEPPADRFAVYPSAVLALSIALTPFSLVYKKPDCTIRSLASSAQTIMRVIIVPVAVPPATLFMRTIVRQQILAGGISTATRD